MSRNPLKDLVLLFHGFVKFNCCVNLVLTNQAVINLSLSSDIGISC